MNALHSNKSAEHYTPTEYIEAARYTMGSIDLDPASSELANQTVGADLFYTKEDNGLELDWAGNVWCNPPGNTKEYRTRPPLPTKFWARLMKFYGEGDVESAVFLAFSLEILQRAQNYTTHAPQLFPICYPKKRIQFDMINETGERVQGKSPTHGNAIICVPPLEGGRVVIERFVESHSEFGSVVVPEGLRHL